MDSSRGVVDDDDAGGRRRRKPMIAVQKPSLRSSIDRDDGADTATLLNKIQTCHIFI
jgi:hypothetical protein